MDAKEGIELRNNISSGIEGRDWKKIAVARAAIGGPCAFRGVKIILGKARVEMFDGFGKESVPGAGLQVYFCRHVDLSLGGLPDEGNRYPLCDIAVALSLTMETSRRLRGANPRAQSRPLPPPLSLSTTGQSSLPLDKLLPATPPSGHSYSHTRSAQDAPSSPLTPSQHPQLRPESWQSVTQDSVLDTLLLSFDRMPGFAAGPAGHTRNMPDLDSDDFDRSSTSFTPPRAFQRLQQLSLIHI